MFTTALALRELLAGGQDIFWHPPDAVCTTLEGWILGLRPAVPPDGKETTKPKAARSRTRATRPAAVPIGSRNRHDQENQGPSGNRAPRGCSIG